MKPVLPVPVGRRMRIAGVTDTEPHKEFSEVIRTVGVHANRFGDHAVEIDRFSRLAAAVWSQRERASQTGLAGRGIVTEGIVEVEKNRLWLGIKWPQRHQSLES